MGLYNSVAECLGAPLSRQQKVALYGRLLHYVFRGCVQADIREWLNTQSLQFDFLAWRRGLHRNGSLLKNVKIFVYSKHVRFPVKAKAFGLDAKEQNAIKLAMEYGPLTATLNEYEKQKRHPLNLELFDKFVVRSIQNPDVTSYIGKFTHKKMGFLIRSFGETGRDLKSELLSYAIYTLQKAYPRFDDVGHMTAIAKTAIKNRGVNMMKEYTTKKRQRLVQNPDGSYQANTVAISTMSNAQVGDPGSQDSRASAVASSYLVTGLDGVVQSAWEQSFSLDQLRSSKRLKPRQKVFLSLMLGEHSPEFSEFLGAPNEEVIESVDHDEYLLDVCEFMSIPVDKAGAFLASLRNVL